MFASVMVQDSAGINRRSRVGDGLLEAAKVTNVSADAASTLTVAILRGGIVWRSGLTVARSDTLDTAANIIAALPALSIGGTFTVRIGNSTANALTILTAAGITLQGRVAVTSGSLILHFEKTSATTLTVTGI